MPVFYPSWTATRHEINEVGGPGEYPHLYLNVSNAAGTKVTATVRRKSKDGKKELSSKPLPLEPWASVTVDLTTMAGEVPGLVQVEAATPVTVALRGTQ